MIVYILLSFIAAFTFALGGVGAAIILIPVLVTLGIPITTAKPVGLFYNTVSLAGATVSNIKNKRLDFRLGIPIIIFSMLFAVAGAWLSKFIATKYILYLFIGFLIFSGSMFLFFKNKKKDDFRKDAPYLSLSIIGAVAGLLSGL
ncbi:MAG: sulfite exporter TauE/SafE family protein, partial [Bacteroidales bacterium]|nr:sulfite exporter TauE/SafE family protein [Bacteroidales bacterium]